MLSRGEPPLFFGGDPRTPHFLQVPVNPDPARYYRIVQTEDEATMALAQGDLPIVIRRSVQEMAPAVARQLVEQARVHQ